MAIMGIQMLITLTIACVFHKVSPYMSPAQWTIRGLKRYRQPPTELLRRYRTGQSAKKGRDKKKTQEPGVVILNDIMFTVPRDNDIQLETDKVQCQDLYNIHFCDNYEWIVNLLCSAVAVYLLTQLYFLCWPEMEAEELNLSVIWLLVVFFNALYIFYLLNVALFRGSEGSGEQSLMILCGASFFVAAMAVMLLDDEILELGINRAYDNITAKVVIFKNRTQLTTKEWHGSLIIWRLFLGIMCALMASFLVFPSFRLAKLHIVSLNQTDNILLKFVYHVSFFAPLFISILWVKPLARDALVDHQDDSASDQKVTDGSFDVFRLGAVLAFCLLRLALLRCHLQSHLLIAQDRFNQIKREPGRIAAVELQSQVQSVFLYLLAVALQYILPVIVLLSWAMLAHSLGGYSFTQGCHLPQQTNLTSNSRYNWGINADDEAVRDFGFIISQFAEVIDTPIFWENHVMFGCWWMVTVGFVLSSCGILYCRYIDV